MSRTSPALSLRCDRVGPVWAACGQRVALEGAWPVLEGGEAGWAAVRCRRCPEAPRPGRVAGAAAGCSAESLSEAAGAPGDAARGLAYRLPPLALWAAVLPLLSGPKLPGSRPARWSGVTTEPSVGTHPARPPCRTRHFHGRGWCRAVRPRWHRPPQGQDLALRPRASLRGLDGCVCCLTETTGVAALQPECPCAASETVGPECEQVVCASGRFPT